MSEAVMLYIMFRISTDLPDILAKDLRGFTQSVHANA